MGSQSPEKICVPGAWGARGGAEGAELRGAGRTGQDTVIEGSVGSQRRRPREANCVVCGGRVAGLKPHKEAGKCRQWGGCH